MAKKQTAQEKRVERLKKQGWFVSEWGEFRPPTREVSTKVEVKPSKPETAFDKAKRIVGKRKK